MEKNEKIGLDFIQINQKEFEENFIKTDILNAKTALYMYVLFRCRTQTGSSHRIGYDEAAEYLGFDPSQIYRAARYLDKQGLIIRKDSGSFYVDIPAMQLRAEQRERNKREKKERPFYEELDQNLAMQVRNMRISMKIGQIHLAYDLLCKTRRERSKMKWVPSEEGHEHILSKLLKYAPDDSIARELYDSLTYV